MQGKIIKQEQEEDKSENINPEITKNFVAFIKDKSEKGTYTLDEYRKNPAY